MAVTKGKSATAKQASKAPSRRGKKTVAFASCDHTEGLGENAVKFTAGQRLELVSADLKKLEELGVVVKGVYVTMKIGVEGRKYSLKPGSKTWLAPEVYQAWKAKGMCAPSDDDPDTQNTLKARELALQEALAERDVALAEKEQLMGRLQETDLIMMAAFEQAEQLRTFIEPDPDSGNVLDDKSARLLGEVTKLIDMFPEQIATPALEQGDDHSQD
ncbi:hypothetical protein PsAD5_02520 [Pseudovibrio sp. Ad5]|uniref:hypothetical protein n=1 Tax=Pseudovibrio sp. Ad5 TaxID=989436 RepID=UPI0007AED62D|nr:hypothetical protein [Pseudovibrio sp. Ad5]KZK96333.1 hypothetical protein PsAD5_02520 [Pseudovibrio sp. Ad5]